MIRIPAWWPALAVACLLYTGGPAAAQALRTKELTTTPKEVTIFLKGAQVFEAGSTSIAPGKSILRISGLSPFIDEKSIQVKATGAFTILNVNHKLNYLQKLQKDAKIDSLQKQLEAIELALQTTHARLEVLREKMSLLNENKKLAGTAGGTTMAQLKQAIEFYETEITAIKGEEITLKKQVEKRKQQETDLKNQINTLNQLPTQPSSEVEITVEASSTAQAQFQLTYLVANAGWYPKYDVRVATVKAPLELTYKAEVYQNTGVDWKNVKLRFSNGDPNKSGVLPELKPWNLNYARFTLVEKSMYGLTGQAGTVRGVVSDDNGRPVAGATVQVKGTQVGTATDANGRYNLTLPSQARTLVFSSVGMLSKEVNITQQDISVSLASQDMALNEVVVVGYASGLNVTRNYDDDRREKAKAQNINTTVIENPTTVEIEVETPYTLLSNSDKLQVELKKHSLEAVYEYYAIPKLDKDAFLVARVVQWDQYNLLPGEANLYFEEAYIGRTILDANTLQDTLTISLGRDKNIVIGREKVQQLSRSRTLGSNTIDSRGFKIVVRNKKNQPIRITLFDQLPVSVVSDITVSATELSKAVLDDKTGQLTWELNLDAQQQREISFQYEVKYPRKEKMILE